jgi:hypothetical protein
MGWDLSGGRRAKQMVVSDPGLSLRDFLNLLKISGDIAKSASKGECRVIQFQEPFGDEPKLELGVAIYDV